MDIGPGYSESMEFRLFFSFLVFTSIEGRKENANQEIRTLASNRPYSQDK